jgi:hypothetical protein
MTHPVFLHHALQKKQENSFYFSPWLLENGPVFLEVVCRQKTTSKIGRKHQNKKDSKFGGQSQKQIVLISIHTTDSKSVPPVKTNWQRTSIEWQNLQPTCNCSHKPKLSTLPISENSYFLATNLWC